MKNKYKIVNLRNYQDDGNHQECVLDLPFKITKGNDDNRWIAILNDNANISLKECFSVKLHPDLNKVLKWCERCYILSLEMEIKRLKKEYDTYIC